MELDPALATGNPLVDGMTKVFLALGRLTEPLFPRPAPAKKEPASMTDAELREALFGVAWPLIDHIGPIHQASFGGRADNDHRWLHPLPTDVPMHVRTLFTVAGDAYGISCIAQQQWASAAGVGALRHLAESLVLVRWLLDGDEAEQRARGYALTAKGIRDLRRFHKELRDVPPDAGDTGNMFSRQEAALASFETDLDALRAEDGAPDRTVPDRRELFDSYLPDAGYASFALHSTIGSHPGPAQSMLFYLDPDVMAVNYDFVGPALQIDRAFWLAESVQLQIEMCRLVAPVLGWRGWEPVVDKAASELAPLQDEVMRRWTDRRRRFYAAPTS